MTLISTPPGLWFPGDDDNPQAWDLVAGGAPLFDPRDSGKVSAWLRVANGTITGQGYSSIPDMLASNPAVQSTDSRRPTAATSANGLPILRFSGTNVLSWPLASNNNQTTTTGCATWLKPTAVNATQRIAMIHVGAGGASTQKFHATLVATGAAHVVGYEPSGSGLNKVGTTANSTLTAGAWVWLRWMFVSSGGTDAEKLLLYVDGDPETLSFTGTGTMTTLPAPTGNILLGNITNDGVFASPFVGDYGPNFFWLGGDLTPTEELALMNFERPT